MNLSLATQYLVELLICSTSLLLLTWGVTKIARGWSAAVRHRAWLLAFAGLAVLPLALLVLPSMNLPILPAVAQEAAIESRTDLPKNDAPFLSERIAEPTMFAEENFAPAQPLETQLKPTPTTIENQSSTQTVVSDEPAIQLPVAPNGSDIQTSNALFWLLFSAWACGFVLILVSLGTAIVANRRLIRNAQLVDAGPWRTMMSELREKLSVHQSVSLLLPKKSVMPMTIGIFQPAVVIPEDSKDWTSSCCRAVLAHELAHIKRHDVLAQTFARLVCGAYWFNPLAWLALRQLRIERELACDDCVIASGQKPSDYARELVQIARAYRLPGNLVGAAMSSSTKLEHRVQSLLDLARSHVPVSRQAAWKLVACALIVILGLSSIRLGRQVISGELLPYQDNHTQSDNEATHFRGVVVDSQGKPIRGAEIAFVHSRTRSFGYNFHSNEILTTAKTDEDGRFDLKVSSELIRAVSDRRPGALIRSGKHSYEEQLSIVATKPGMGADWRTVFDLLRGLPTSEIKLKLLPEVPINGKLLDPEGNPLENVTVRVYSIFKSFPTTDWKEWESKLPDNGFPIADVCCTQLNPSLDQTVRTDSNGDFRLLGFAPNQSVTLEVSGGGVAKSRISVLTRQLDEPLPSGRVDQRYLVNLHFGSTFEMIAPLEQKIFGSVKDKDTGQPIAGVTVEAHSGFVKTITDENGNYELGGLPQPADDAQPVRVSLIPAEDTPYLGASYVQVPRAAALEPVEFNVEFKKAVWLEGTLLDQDSGLPEFGYVGFSPNLDNEIAKTFERYTPGRMGILPEMIPTEPNGKFRIPVSPGQGILVATSPQLAKFETGFGEKEGENLPRGLNPEVFKYYQLMNIDAVNSIKTLDIPETNPPEVKIFLKRLPVKTLKVRDSDNNPITQVRAIGAYSSSMTSPQQRLESNAGSSSDEVEVYGLEAESRRMMLFHQSEKNLGLAKVVRKDDEADVTLLPCATIRGKVEGLVPWGYYPTEVVAFIPRANIPGATESEFIRDMVVARTSVAADGSFQLQGVLPGVELELGIQSRQFKLKNKGEAIEPGEVIDLGTLDMQSKTSPQRTNEDNMATKASDN